MSQTHTTRHPNGAASKDTIQSDQGRQDRRDEQGRFAAGNRFGLGNSYARRAGRLRQVIQDEVSDDDLRRIVRALIDKAAEGDVAAARVLLAYAVGKPQPAPEPDRATAQEAQTLTEQAQAGLQLARVAPEVAHEALSATIPNYGQTLPPDEEDEDDRDETDDPAEVANVLLRGLGRLPADDRRELAQWFREGRPPEAVVTAAAPSKPPR